MQKRTIRKFYTLQSQDTKYYIFYYQKCSNVCEADSGHVNGCFSSATALALFCATPNLTRVQEVRQVSGGPLSFDLAS
jgi:hypothetical protein